MRKIPILAILPPLIFVALAGLFLGGMFRENPDTLPSAQEGFAAPAIETIPVSGMPSFGMDELNAPGPKVVNFWASWCAPCRVEHPFLIDIAKDAPVYGVNRDRTPQQAQRFLDELGNPFKAVIADPKNRQSIEWGVYALPETFVLDGDGNVIYHLRGPINEALYRNRILPAIEAASAE